MLDEKEFLGPHGIRSLSRYHLEHPFVFQVAGQEYTVPYLPAESNTGMFGGNSNWRGPVWMPVNALILRALINLYGFYGDEFKVQCPTGSGCYMTLFEVAQEIVSPADQHLPARCQRATASLWRDSQVPGRSALARSDSVLRVFRRRERRRGSEPATRRDGQVWWPFSWIYSVVWTPRTCLKPNAGGSSKRSSRIRCAEKKRARSDSKEKNQSC